MEQQNYTLTTEKPPYDRIHTAEDIKDINRFIVKLREDLGMPVCATALHLWTRPTHSLGR